LQRRRKLAHARKEREEKRLVHLDRIVKLRREAREIRDWLASLPDDAKPSEDNDLGRMLIWVCQRLGEIDRQTGIEAARSFAVIGDLFPEIDELQDPLGDPPERNGWYY
jgi:hypothetical protein